MFGNLIAVAALRTNTNFNTIAATIDHFRAGRSVAGMMEELECNLIPNGYFVRVRIDQEKP